ncbi:MAG: restriction endonuclease subunit S [Halioglobus sp.]|nr:restriction endonuclease subunit S [Halioglobus sp.]
MAGEWRPSNWGDEVSLEYGKAIRGYSKTHGKYRVFGSNGPIGWTAEPLAQGPGVILGRKGAYRGVEYWPDPYWVIDTAYYLVPKTDLDMRWLYYAVKHYKLGEIDDGSPIPSTTRAAVYMQDVDVPPKPEQRAIAHILGTLDDKIELNRRRNQTLEAMARALFNDWFVDFGPVRAKMEGRWKPGQSIPGLPTHIYDLFPDQLVESELGEIPEGWRYQTLAQLTDKVGSGATPRGGSKVYIDEGVALIRSQNVYDSLFVWDGLVRISDEAAEQLKGVTVQQEDVLLNITGASILRTCIVEASVLPARVNQHVAIIRTKPGVPPRFVHMHLLRPDIKNYMLGLNAGASREAITKGHIESLPLLTPSSELLEAFRSETDPLFQRGKCISQEIRWLGELRDTLLPKLLSGELRIKDAKRFMEGARV